ncbi:MAG: hypothetical protein RL033_3807, partial [Pseudomonadota bacterium]
MHKLSGSSLAIGSLCALLGALACSSEPSNNNSASGMPGVFGGPSNMPGTSTNPNQPTANQPSTVTGSGGSEGQSNPVLNTGGSTAVSSGGSAGAPPVVDVAPQATPGGYFESGTWHGYAWTG